MSIPPLSFRPLPVAKPWGGVRLSAFGRDLPPGERIGESWEISDYEGRRTEVASGPLAGRTLRRLCADFGDALLGRTRLDRMGRYPLLLKLIDAEGRLSVQLHPSDEAAASLGDPDGGKEEAWYVLESEPPGRLALGLAPGVEPEALWRARSPREVESLLRWVPVKTGDFGMIPPGTVHAVDAGVVLMEIQQTSDATYRIHDWERTGTRELHLERAAAAVDPESRPEPRRVVFSEEETTLAEGRRLSVSALRVDGRLELDGAETILLFCAGGNLLVRNEAGKLPLPQYGSAFLPAAPEGTLLEGEGTILIMRARME